MLLAFIRREDYCNAWHPMAGGWGRESLGVLCQAPRSRETSSLEMAKKLALLVPGVPRSHGAELSKRCTMKSPAKASNSFSTISSAPRAHAAHPQEQKPPAATTWVDTADLPQHTACCHHPTPLPEVSRSVCLLRWRVGWLGYLPTLHSLPGSAHWLLTRSWLNG